MSALRMLLPGSAVVGDLDDDRGDALQALADLYAYPAPLPSCGWVRGSMVTTLDGSATGSDGLSGTIGGAADRLVFRALRGLADVVLVGSGTARQEKYRPAEPDAAFADRRATAGQTDAPVVAVVTRSGDVPVDTGLFSPDVRSLVVTCSAADVGGLRDRFGAERVVVAGEDDVDPTLAAAQLAATGLRRIQLEGGPTLLGRFEQAARLDELCLTLAPSLVAGSGPRIAHGPRAAVNLRAAHLIECDGVLLGRWLAQPA